MVYSPKYPSSINTLEELRQWTTEEFGYVGQESASNETTDMDLQSQITTLLTSVDGLQGLAGRNLIVNGGMEVYQRQFGSYGVVGSTSPAFVVDMFAYQATTTANVTLSQDSDAPAGFTKSFKIVVTAADVSIASTDLAFVYTAIEGVKFAKYRFGSALAMPFSIGFKAKHHRTGVYCVAFSNAAGTRSYIVEYTINAADTWEYKTATIPGDTTGTWDTSVGGVGLYIFWMLMCGSGRGAGTAGVWTASNNLATGNQVNAVGATSDSFQIVGISVVMGSKPVPDLLSPYAQPHFDEALWQSRRYWQKTFPYGTTPADNSGNSGSLAAMTGTFSTGVAMVLEWEFKPAMCRTPSITKYNPNATGAGLVGDFYGGATTYAIASSATAERCVFQNAITAGTTLTPSLHAVADASL